MIRKRDTKNNRGFTLVEVVVTIVIIGILSTMVVENIVSRIILETKRSTLEMLNEYQKSIETYIANTSVLPANISDLEDYIKTVGNDYNEDAWGKPLQFYSTGSTIDPTISITNGSQNCSVIIYSYGVNGQDDSSYDGTTQTFNKGGDDMVICYPSKLLYSTKYYKTQVELESMNIRCSDYVANCACTPASLSEIVNAGYATPDMMYDEYGQKMILDTSYGIYSKGENKTDDSRTADDILPPTTTCF